MSMMTKREHNFIALRITHALSEAATMAANWGVTRENFVTECGVAWDQMTAMLNTGVVNETLTASDTKSSNPAAKVGQVWDCKGYGRCVVTYASDKRVRMRWIEGEYSGREGEFDSAGPHFFEDPTFAKFFDSRPVADRGQIWDFRGTRFTNRRPHYNNPGHLDQKQNGWCFSEDRYRDDYDWFSTNSFETDEDLMFIGYENDPDRGTEEG